MEAGSQISTIFGEFHHCPHKDQYLTCLPSYTGSNYLRVAYGLRL